VKKDANRLKFVSNRPAIFEERCRNKFWPDGLHCLVTSSFDLSEEKRLYPVTDKLEIFNYQNSKHYQTVSFDSAQQYTGWPKK